MGQAGKCASAVGAPNGNVKRNEPARLAPLPLAAGAGRAFLFLSCQSSFRPRHEKKGEIEV